MMRRRKLLTSDTVMALIRDMNTGVPLALAMRKQSLTLSRPAVARICEAWTEAIDTLPNTGFEGSPEFTTIRDSLFPDWLTVDEQEQPDGIEYEGEWLLGAWVWK